MHYFWAGGLERETTSVLRAPRSFFGLFQNVLPFPVHRSDVLAIAGRSQALLDGPFVCYDVLLCRCYNVLLQTAYANGVTSSRCIRSGVCCGAVPCAVSGLLYVAVAVCRADTCWGPLRYRVPCRYIAVADTRSGATHGACIATRIALPTRRIRGHYDNIYVTN